MVVESGGDTRSGDATVLNHKKPHTVRHINDLFCDDNPRASPHRLIHKQMPVHRITFQRNKKGSVPDASAIAISGGDGFSRGLLYPSSCKTL